ncbi:MAG: tetratricopeptide repeat protein [Proteobacteria bacterium]|nr:tetratricopeptide repeat protein [Pseudomonadota bacterium]
MPEPSRKFVVPAACLIALCVVLAWSNTFSVPFLDDDVPSIVDNPAVRSFWPWWEVLAQRPPNLGARPVVLLSLAANHAVSGLDPWSYHAVNLLAHILAAWLLFGILRRTLARLPGAGRRATDLTAFFVALAWALHPLQTQAVTYVIQRCEVFMGLFFFLALYLAVRGWDSDRPRPWRLASVGACVLGMGSKEVMVVAPLAIFAYDWVFVHRSLKGALRSSPMLWTGYAAALGFLALLRATIPVEGVLETGTVLNHTRAEYLLTQPEILLHYLRLALWPHPLVFSYGWKAAGLARAWLPGLAVLALMAASAWGVARKRPLGYAGFWFFLILVPTSWLAALNVMAAEHRLYLPLAAVCAVAVAGGRAGALALGERLWPGRGLPRGAALAGWALAAVACASLGTAAYARNGVYESDVRLWADAAEKRPDNFRALSNLGKVLLDRGELARAKGPLTRTVELAPDFAEGQYNLGSILAMEGENDLAEKHLRQALRLKPGLTEAWINLAQVLLAKNAHRAALEALDRALRLDPKNPFARVNRGMALRALGLDAEADREMRMAEALDPGLPPLLMARALAEESRGNFPGAEALYWKAIHASPHWPHPRLNLGILQARQGRTAEALESLDTAVALAPGDPDAWYNLGVALDRAGQAGRAAKAFRRALELRPGHETALYNLGGLLARAGDIPGAVRAWTALTEAHPGHLKGRLNLGKALLLQKHYAQAADQFAAALSLDPENETAREGLDQARNMAPGAAGEGG